ncbi:MAG: heparinase II/III family protein, partial [Candidatus Hydrogenedentes bacterium]|nr:heparinase II/III family protein [Candidatus Hydrogenedentota bacterium]
PLKDQRTLHTDETIALARKNIAEHAAAAAIASNILTVADKWVVWEDAELRQLVSTADVPRAFNVGTAGCPECGGKIYEEGGTYPWIIDPRKPFKVECPVDGSVYPGNDYAGYYQSEFKDETKLAGEHSDNGWGWVGPDGHRYWFVAYANHWIWRNHTVPAVHNLGRAYVITGDLRYAHKAAVLLDRIAEVYPNMDYHTQSRYGQLQAAHAARYEGKTVNNIWETGVVSILSETYDSVWETIDGDKALQDLCGRSGEAIRANIEANFLEDAIDGYFSGKVRGNFGMHQRALVYAGLTRQYGEQEKWFDGLLNNAESSPSHIGLNYALYNLVYRDGVPFETAPGYNFSWVHNITDVANMLALAGYDVFAIPKLKLLYDGVLDVVNAGQFTPDLGDSGSVYGGKVGMDADVYQTAYRAYGDERYLNLLAEMDALGEKSFRTYETLFRSAIPPVEPQAVKQSARVLDGYGMAILNNPADTCSLALYYGYLGGHGHFDRLHFELFAHGQPLMPDLGYPDFMNAYVPGIFTWSKNTISHNTVTVDASRQPKNQAGVVNEFVNGEFARVLDIAAPGTYPQTSEYRRRVVMVDVDESNSYFVDVFSVADGSEHDYSLHGPPGTFSAASGELSEPAPGTLAGEDVPLAEIYDDPGLAQAGYEGVYTGYMGSGFQHLFNVQRLTNGALTAEFAHEKDLAARLRIYLPNQPEQEVFVADAQVSPVKHKQLVKYIIARRSGENLSSRFVSVIEPFGATPLLTGVARLERDDEAVVIEIKRPGAVDYVVALSGGHALGELPADIDTDAAFAVVTLNDGAEHGRVFFSGGTYLAVAGHRFEAQPVTGRVASVEPLARTIRVALDSSSQAAPIDPAAVAHFSNDRRRTAHRLAQAEVNGGELTLVTRDALLVGRARVSAVEAQALATPTGFMFAPVYAGAYAAPTDFTSFRCIETVSDGAIRLLEPLPEDAGFSAGSDAWIVNVAPGDTFEMTANSEGEF